MTTTGRPDDRSPADGPAARREATAAEAKALAHPTRLRILFACRDVARTNKELAEELESTPGTIHYHLRPLVEQGFLRPEAPRPGPRGSREQPYRATGRSWELAGTSETASALREVALEEVIGAGEDRLLDLARVGLTLTDDECADLLARLQAVVDQAVARERARVDAGRPTPPGATPVTLLLALTRAAAGSTIQDQGPRSGDPEQR